MKLFVFAVRDRAADVYMRPFQEVSVASAIRSFTDAVNTAEGSNALYKHPEDFDLYIFGSFDDNDGVFACGTPRQVAIGKDVKVVGNGGA